MESLVRQLVPVPEVLLVPVEEDAVCVMVVESDEPPVEQVSPKPSSGV